MERFSAAQIGASQTVTIGAGGTGGNNTGTNGGNGGATTLGTLFSAGGGAFGQGTGTVGDGNIVLANSGAGGSAVNGLVNTPGGGAFASFYAAAFTGDIFVGCGGGSFLTPPGPANGQIPNGLDASVAAVAGSGFGRGATGGVVANVTATQTNRAGAAGAAGGLLILEFIQ
jgi:hypothetical protein